MIDYISNGLKSFSYVTGHRSFVEDQLRGLGADGKKAREIFLLIVEIAGNYSRPSSPEYQSATKRFVAAMSMLPKRWDGQKDR